MSLTTNSLRVQVDTPIWEWCRTAPAVSSAISTSTASDSAIGNPIHGRYIYYLISAAGFYRYDTWTDTYMQLSSPPIAPATWASMKFSGAYGFEARALDASATTVTAPAYFGQVLKGFDIRIESGTGAGQRRTITGVSEATVVQTGIMTAISAGLTFTNSLSTAAINQYAGYQFRIIAGAGIGQVRRILHHTATVFTYADILGYEIDYDTNPAVPNPVFVAAAAGVGSVYQIESSVITVNSAWDVTPDSSSHFVVEAGGIFLASSAAAAPFFTLQFYSVASDTWYIRSATSALMTAVGTDGVIERTVRNASLYEAGTATGGTTTTLIDTTSNWTVNEFVGKWVRFVSGTIPAGGADRLRKITANTATQLTWVGSTTTAPDATTRYRIEGYDAGFATAGTTATTLEDTNASASSWTADRWKNYRVAIISGTGIGQERKIFSNDSTTLTLYPDNNWDVTPDTTSGYIIINNHNKIYLLLGGQAAMIGHSIDADMAANSNIVDYGTPRQGAVILCNSSGVRARRPQAINTLTRSGTTATCTTVNPHRLKVGDYFKVMGATGGDAALYNITTQVVSVTSATVFTYTMVGTPGANATFTGHSASTLTDASQNWTINGWANYICYFAITNPPAGTGALVSVGMEIASNTATTLTFKTNPSLLPGNGIGRYVIAERAAHGAYEYGIATGAGQLTTAIADSSKNWPVNIHTGRRVKKIAGAGQADIEGIVSSNTATVLTITVAGTLPVANSTTYAILDIPIRGLGTSLLAIFGTSDSSISGKYLYSPRGGASYGWDRYNISTNRWEMLALSPQVETLTTGSNFCYDGNDRIYFTKDNTQRIYYFDLVTSWVHGAGQYPYLAPTAVIGNRMEIIETADHLKYLWINRASNVECFKQLMWY
ncbi:hypothetical protein KBC40_02695 [Patescibacteria group bacterium]|nr:hypothetical protein [Patescibacteria group bacterium]